MSESEDDLSVVESDDGKVEGSGSAPIMSIFASYYGIEESTSQNDMEVKGTIDDSNFNSGEYVKSILLYESVEGMYAKDAELVQEIRSLDGEMQKLVYDNYNKFITATETIKEMKTDVYAMDEDISVLRSHVQTIVVGSKSLDTNFEAKRAEVDKLVRIRRLLDRLEFLSELPEKLALMIESKHYKEAVELYKKTISVLTRHSHVLSFKKIKERTELMMADLTIKVINLLEDVSLEPTKLTHYIVVLRMMNAPRDKVMQKYVMAHDHRSKSLIEHFTTALKDLANGESTAWLTATREFHQTILARLIEACSGFKQLYDQEGEERKNALKSLTNMLHRVFNDYKSALMSSFQSVFQRFSVKFSKLGFDFEGFVERADAEFIQELRMIEHLISNKRLISSSNYDCQDGEVIDNKFAVIEERNSWIFLARQAVLDVHYLESVIKQIENSHNGQENCKIAEAFATDMFQCLEQHCELLLHQNMKFYMCKLPNWVEKIYFLVNIDKYISCTNSEPEVQIIYDKYGGKGGIANSIYFMKRLQDFIYIQVCGIFADFLRSMKPVVDIYDAINRNMVEVIRELASLFTSTLCKTALQSTCLPEEKGLYALVFDGQQGLGISEESLELLKEDSAEDHNQIMPTKIGLKKSITWQSANESESEVAEIHCLLLAAILRRLGKSLSDSMEEEFDRQDLSLQRMNQRLRILKSDVLDGWLTKSSQLLLNYFIEANQYRLSEITSLYLRKRYAEYYDDKDCGPESNLIASADVISLADYLQNVALCANIIFLEMPYGGKPNSSVDRDFLRRSSVVRQSMVGGGTNLQFDIDRLFSQRVKVYEFVPFDLTVESILNYQFKIVFKLIQEKMKVMTLKKGCYMSFAADMNFIKQIAAFTMKDVREIENMTDNISATLFGRYEGAGDVSSAADNFESNMIGKLVNESLSKFYENCILTSRR